MIVHHFNCTSNLVIAIAMACIGLRGCWMVSSKMLSDYFFIYRYR